MKCPKCKRYFTILDEHYEVGDEYFCASCYSSGKPNEELYECEECGDLHDTPENAGLCCEYHMDQEDVDEMYEEGGT